MCYLGSPRKKRKREKGARRKKETPSTSRVVVLSHQGPVRGTKKERRKEKKERKRGKVKGRSGGLGDEAAVALIKRATDYVLSEKKKEKKKEKRKMTEREPEGTALGPPGLRPNMP